MSVEQFKTVRLQVRAVLAEEERARNDDRWLYVRVLERFYDHDGDLLTLGEWVDADCPDYESVRRSRADIQSSGEFQPTDPVVRNKRKRREADVRKALGYTPEPVADATPRVEH